MPITSQRRIPAAIEFVRLGFGDTIDENAPFRSLEFLTETLTTTEVQAVLPIVKQFNSFNGEKVAAGLERFRGKVSGWKFGAAGSPLLIAVLAPWTHQAEEISPRSPSGSKFSDDQRKMLITEMRALFLDELDADKFEMNGDYEYEFGAWWD